MLSVECATSFGQPTVRFGQGDPGQPLDRRPGHEPIQEPEGWHHHLLKKVSWIDEEPIRQEGLDTPDVTTAEDVGHANTSMTTDVYFGRKVAVTGAAAVFQALDT